MQEWKVIIPTYRRKTFRALNLLKKDKLLEITLAVRKSEYKKGFYDHLKGNKRIHFMLLKHVHDLGDTRHRILQECKKNKIEYCVMLDDNVYDLYFPENPKKYTITQCLNNAEKELKLYMTMTVGLEFALKSYWKIAKLNQYSTPVQGYMIHVPTYFKTGVKFVRTKKCGFEDFTYAYGLWMKDWYFYNSKCVCRKCNSWEPYNAKAGGTHSEKQKSPKEYCKLNDKHWIVCYNYLKRKYKDVSKLRMITIKKKGYKFNRLFVDKTK